MKRIGGVYVEGVHKTCLWTVFNIPHIFILLVIEQLVPPPIPYFCEQIRSGFRSRGFVSLPSMAAMAVSSAVSSKSSGLAMSIKCPSPASSSPSLPPAKLGYSRRLLLPALVGAPLLLQQQSASAKDIPLFGIRKRVEEAEKEVVQEVKELVKEGKELVKEGEKEISSVVAPAAAAVVATPNIDSPPPAYQAAAVAGAEFVAVLVASSVVNGLVSES